jgi:hypothetical protein
MLYLNLIVLKAHPAIGKDRSFTTNSAMAIEEVSPFKPE